MLFLAQYRIRVRYVYFKVMLKKIVATDEIENKSLLLQKHQGGKENNCEYYGFPFCFGCLRCLSIPRSLTKGKRRSR